MQQHDDVQAVVDGQSVAGLLVAAVPEISRMADDRQGHITGNLPVPEANQVRGIVARIVADEHVLDPRSEAFGHPVEDPRQRRRGVVGDD